ncbi:MAG: CPBP family intramembrane metalloprotease [Lachnospiraceae bacterium]|nr:CPBP family intramembrane metalloprotease [Lachnospiraceae bacterium]
MQKKILRMLLPLLVYEIVGELVFVLWQFGHGQAREAQALPLTALASVLSSVLLGREYRHLREGTGPGGKEKAFSRGHFYFWANCLAAGIGACLFFNGVLRLLPIPGEGYRQSGRILYGPPLMVQLACMGILIPLGEELVFRGLLYGRLRQELPFWKAAAVSALCFGLFHGNLIQGVYAGLLGMFLAAVFEHGQSLWGCWLFHSAANIAAIFLTHILGEEGGQAGCRMAMAVAGGGLLMAAYNTIRRDGKRT